MFSIPQEMTCNTPLHLEIWNWLISPPDDKLWTSPAGTARRGPRQWLHPWWSWRQYISQNDWSYRCGWFWRYQKLRGKYVFWSNKGGFRRPWKQVYDFMLCSYPPRWGLLQESAAQSRSVVHLQQPGTATSAWCSQFSLLLILHCQGNEELSIILILSSMHSLH